MALAIGSALGLLVGLVSLLSGLDRDRGFYPTVLIVVSTYYVLFACMGDQAAIGPEVAGSAAFTILALVGLRTSLWVVVAGLVAHGLQDFVHAQFIENAGVPAWWPAFCGSIDLVLAACLAARLRFPRLLSTAPRAGHEPR